ncbi:MAG: MarR family transcriptional regulator [Alphaproteobacteria bacterium]|nr:MarR family transcriptional regulator [Alphaproteobacteria bacterium]
MFDFDAASDSLPRRIREGLDRLSLVLRSEHWAAAGALGLSPTQLQVLWILAGRDSPLPVKDIARHLGVTQPTATDSIRALADKMLVGRSTSTKDARSTLVTLTEAGRQTLKAAGAGLSLTEAAVAALDQKQQEILFVTLMSLIRTLLHRGAIPAQRMCVMCRHFRPFAHSGSDTPHHCAFVDAAFGTRHLRIDCRDHEPADPACQAATWQAFFGAPGNLQASN